MIQIGELTREERRKLAVKHFDDITNDKEIYNDIVYSIYNTNIYNVDNFKDVNVNFHSNFHTKISVTDNDTVTELFSMPRDGKNITILNFASYKNPGGMYYQGSSAQEEFLCHHSTLYPVLSNFVRDYYDINKKNLNYALYKNTGMYSCDIRFFDYHLDQSNITYDNTVLADVITCAAPNVTTFKKYQSKRLGLTSEQERKLIYDSMYDRCKLILGIAAYKGTEKLILGAFGCGVFGNDPYMVAEIFLKLLFEEFPGVFDEVRFAIPKGKNYDAFKKVFKA